VPTPAPIDAGRTFAEALKAKVPTLATQIDALLAAPEAVEELGRGVLMRQDHSRLMNEAAEVKRKNDEQWNHLQGQKTQLDTWYTNAQADLDLGRKARAANWKPGDPDPNPDPTDPSRTTPTGLTVDEVNKLMTEREMGQAQFVTTLNDISLRHFQRFGEVLDTVTLTQELMRDPAARERGLIKHYQHKFADQISAADKKAADADFERRYQERFTTDVAKLRSAPPYPTGAGDAGSPLDALEVKPSANAGGSVDEMVAEYNRLVSVGKAQ
jgi:hypothetical protein